MALGTARDKRAEYVQPFLLILGQRVRMAVGILIVATVQRDQRDLEGSDGGVDLVQPDPRTTMPEIVRPRLCEQCPVRGNVIEGFQQPLRAVAHFVLVVKRPQHLLLQATDPGVPEKGLHEGDVPQAGSRARQRLAKDPSAAAQPIGKAAVGIVAAGAGNGTVAGKHWIEKKEATQIGLLWCEAVTPTRQAGLQSTHPGVFQ